MSASSLTKIRNRLAEAREELRELPTAPLPREEALRAIERWVHGQASRFDARGAATPFRRPDPGAVHILELSALERGPHHGTVDVGPLVCRLMPDDVIALLAGGLPDDDSETGPPAVERPAIRARLMDEIDALERREELEIRALDARGERVSRRADARPEIVLAYKRTLERGDNRHADR